MYIYIYIIFNALLNVYQQGYVVCNLFFLIFFIFYCPYHIHIKKSFFLKILQKNSKLVILSNLGMHGHTHLKR